MIIRNLLSLSVLALTGYLFLVLAGHLWDRKPRPWVSAAFTNAIWRHALVPRMTRIPTVQPPRPKAYSRRPAEEAPHARNSRAGEGWHARGDAGSRLLLRCHA